VELPTKATFRFEVMYMGEIWAAFRLVPDLQIGMSLRFRKRIDSFPFPLKVKDIVEVEMKQQGSEKILTWKWIGIPKKKNFRRRWAWYDSPERPFFIGINGRRSKRKPMVRKKIEERHKRKGNYAKQGAHWKRKREEQGILVNE